MAFTESKKLDDFFKIEKTSVIKKQYWFLHNIDLKKDAHVCYVIFKGPYRSLKLNEEKFRLKEDEFILAKLNHLSKSIKFEKLRTKISENQILIDDMHLINKGVGKLEVSYQKTTKKFNTNLRIFNEPYGLIREIVLSDKLYCFFLQNVKIKTPFFVPWYWGSFFLDNKVNLNFFKINNIVNPKFGSLLNKLYVEGHGRKICLDIKSVRKDNNIINIHASNESYFLAIEFEIISKMTIKVSSISSWTYNQTGIKIKKIDSNIDNLTFKKVNAGIFEEAQNYVMLF